MRAILLLTAGLTRAVFAQQTEYAMMFERSDAVEAYADASYSYDDNIFRLPDVARVGEPTSDESWKREVGVTVDKIISHQHFTGNLDAYKVTFDRFNQIDYTGKDAVANWNWGIFSDLSGDIGSTYTQSLTPYSQFHTEQLNLRTERRNYFDESWLMTPRWALRAAISEDRLTYDLDSEQPLNRVQHIHNIGLDYLSPLGNKAGITLQHERDDFPVLQNIGPFAVDNSYTEDEVLTDVDYTYSPTMHFHMTAGWLRWKFDEFSQRDISGATAALNLYWTPTPKSTVTTTIWHGVSATQELTVNYSVNEGMSVGPVWNVSDKVQAGGSLRAERLDYANSTNLGPGQAPQRIDIMRDVSASLVYTPERRVQITLVMYADRLNSTVAINQYRDHGLVLNLKGTF